MTEITTATTPLAKLSIKDSVLAQFKEAELTIVGLAEKYKNVVYAVATPSGMRDAIAARADLRDNGRLFVTKSQDRIKGEVNDLKRVMADETERLVSIVKPVEDSIDAQIKVEEKRKADEKAERDRKEAERNAREQVAREQAAEARRLADIAAFEKLEADEIARLAKQNAAVVVEVPAPVAAPAPVATVIPFAAPRPTAAPATPPTLKLGDIGARLAPIAISGAGLSQLGFEPAAINQNSRLYFEHEFPLICAALVKHLQSVQAKQAA